MGSSELRMILNGRQLDVRNLRHFSKSYLEISGQTSSQHAQYSKWVYKAKSKINPTKIYCKAHSVGIDLSRS
jgi:hypothetical protein